MRTTDYCDYKLSLALKECGFDEPCDHYYCAFDNETDVRFWHIHPAQSQNGLHTQKDTVVADAPTLAHAQKWLREVKSIDVLIWNCACGYGWEISKADPQSRGTTLKIYDDNGEDRYSGMWLTYENALAAGIAAAIQLFDNEKE